MSYDGRYYSDTLIPCESERSQPLISSFCVDVAETVWESISSAFYLVNSTFDVVSIFMSFVSKIEVVFRQARWYEADQLRKQSHHVHRVCHGAQRKPVCKGVICCRLKLCVEQSLVFGSTAAYSQ